MAINIGGVARAQVPAALGLGQSAGALEKLTIRYEEKYVTVFSGTVEALFNPNEIGVSKEVSWNKEELAGQSMGYPYQVRFTGQQPAKLTLNLFFDTYEGDPNAASSIGGSFLESLKGTPLALFPGASPSGVSVVKYTEQIAQLAHINRDLHRPPVCRLFWGKWGNKIALFEGVLTSLEQKYTMFLADGTPVRATLTCTFTQHSGGQAVQFDLHSADVHKTYTVRRGDTLSSIAAQEYNDPALWRHIATANGLTNPRVLTPGQVLRVPKLDT